MARNSNPGTGVIYEFTEENLAELDEVFVPDLSRYRCPVCNATPIYIQGHCSERWRNPKLSCHSPIAKIGVTCSNKECAMNMTYSISSWIKYSQMKKKKIT